MEQKAQTKLRYNDPSFGPRFDKCSETLARMSLATLLSDYKNGAVPPVLGPLTYEQAAVMAEWIALAAVALQAINDVRAQSMDLVAETSGLIASHIKAVDILKKVAYATPDSRELLAARLQAAAFVTSPEHGL